MKNEKFNDKNRPKTRFWESWVTSLFLKVVTSLFTVSLEFELEVRYVNNSVIQSCVTAHRSPAHFDIAKNMYKIQAAKQVRRASIIVGPIEQRKQVVYRRFTMMFTMISTLTID